MMSTDKKFGIVMLATIILSVINIVVAFAVGAWILPEIPPSQFFAITQVTLVFAFLMEVFVWMVMGGKD